MHNMHNMHIDTLIALSKTMSDREIAEAVGVTQQTVARWWQGRIPKARNWALLQRLLTPEPEQNPTHPDRTVRNRPYYRISAKDFDTLDEFHQAFYDARYAHGKHMQELCDRLRGELTSESD